ncbi:MAG: conjugal transfer protein MobA [Mangrovibacterium sp.]
MEKEEKKKNAAGRPKEADPARNAVMVRFTDAEYARFMMLFEQSGVFAKSAFVKARVFDEAFRVVKIDQSKLKYIAKLSEMQAQFRAVGVNYNQVVKMLHQHFSEKTARAMLYKLEKLTVELVKISHRMEELTDEMKRDDS